MHRGAATAGDDRVGGGARRCPGDTGNGPAAPGHAGGGGARGAAHRRERLRACGRRRRDVVPGGARVSAEPARALGVRGLGARCGAVTVPSSSGLGRRGSGALSRQRLQPSSPSTAEDRPVQGLFPLQYVLLKRVHGVLLHGEPGRREHLPAPHRARRLVEVHQLPRESTLLRPEHPLLHRLQREAGSQVRGWVPLRRRRLRAAAL